MPTTTTIALALSAVLTAPAGSSAPAPAGPSITAPRLDSVPRPSRGKATRLSTSKRRTARAFTAAGAGLLGVAYLGGTLAAAVQLDEVREDGVIETHERDLVRISHLMFVPVVGPFVAAPLAESGKDKAAFVGHGVLQALATSYLVVGSVMLVRDQRARRWALSAAAAPGGGTVALRGRF